MQSIMKFLPSRKSEVVTYGTQVYDVVSAKGYDPTSIGLSSADVTGADAKPIRTPSGSARLGDPPSLSRSLRFSPLLFHLFDVLIIKPIAAGTSAMKRIRGKV